MIRFDLSAKSEWISVYSLCRNSLSSKSNGQIWLLFRLFNNKNVETRFVVIHRILEANSTKRPFWRELSHKFTILLQFSIAAFYSKNCREVAKIPVQVPKIAPNHCMHNLCLLFADRILFQVCFRFTKELTFWSITTCRNNSEQAWVCRTWAFYLWKNRSSSGDKHFS